MMKDDDKKENARTIYLQRYETFRHLDRTRWLLYGQIAVVFSTFAVSVILRFSKIVSPNLFLVTIFLFMGIILILSGASMGKVTKGLHENSKVLKKFGEQIGDNDIPITKISRHSVAWWMKWIAIIAGAASIILSFYTVVSLAE